MQTSQNKILLIDDDEIFLFVAIATLEASFSDADIRVVMNGQDALDYIAHSEVKMIFLDLNMPKMNGWQFLDEIYRSKKHEDFAIFIMTSSIDPTDEELAAVHPAKPVFFRKPISKAKLREIVEYIRNPAV